MIILGLVAVTALWLSFANGANDNFKGVATLYGSDTTTFRGALWWSSITTFAGSVVSVLIAKNLMVTFSGKGLLPDGLASSPAFALAVGLGAALTIFMATRIGMPTSTTHSLIGGLLGTGIAANQHLELGVLLHKFAIPMLISPIIAVLLAGPLYLLFSTIRKRMGVTKNTCMCVADGSWQPVGVANDDTMSAAFYSLEVTVDESAVCAERYQGGVLGVSAQSTVDVMHYLSAGAVCFSRALNDTPKIAALLLTTSVFSPSVGIGMIAVAMLIGGVLQSRRVAEVMSKQITSLNVGQGLTANLSTAAIVLFASNIGVPVSTTHVSVGSIFAIGVVNKSCKWKAILGILATWMTTLPIAALLSGLLYLLIIRF